jgi:Zn-dependent metalloprotease
MPMFHRINISATSDDNQPRLRGITRFSPAATAAQEAARQQLGMMSVEGASRTLLQAYLEDAGDFGREVTSPERSELLPDMVVRNISAAPALNASTVAFQQTSKAIPIFGARVVVDIDSVSKTLVAINGRVAPIPNARPLATLSAQAALSSLIEWSRHSFSTENMETPPLLNWFLDEETEIWHLAYHFTKMGLLPRDDVGFLPLIEYLRRERRGVPIPSFDYFVDAHSGEVVFLYSSVSQLGIPSAMKGLDCDRIERNFFGHIDASAYFLRDPLRNIETYDYNFADKDQYPQPPLPKSPISHGSFDLASASPEAVSAHYNATLVFDFYNAFLQHKGIDGKGMKLVSVVNVYSSYRNPLKSPEWGNAEWWQDRMWYGQESGTSFAKYLDIIGHELTHGVTAASSGLINRDLPGALNESYSDAFGIIIANWYPGTPNSIGTWSWKLGSSLGTGRDFADPASTGQSDHMSQYVPLPPTNNNGGVHKYCGIHNKAIYKLLTNVDAVGQLTFPTKDAVLLLFLTLTRLTDKSDFLASRRTLETMTRAYWGTNQPTLAVRLGAIATAFDAVGIR